MRKRAAQSSFLDGQLLIAMPGMKDPRFARSVIYMCAHSDEGAMGLIINQHAPDISFDELLMRTRIDRSGKRTTRLAQNIPIHVGGPVDTGRGFVLHSAEYHAQDATVSINDQMSLTATIDILRAMARGTGPDNAILALGYSGWDSGQLEQEILANGWLNCPATPELVFDPDIDGKYERALLTLGISPPHLVSEAGHA